MDHRNGERPFPGMVRRTPGRALRLRGRCPHGVVGNQCGVAIVMVLMVMTILLAIGFELHRRALAGLEGVAAVGFRVTAAHMASSGVHAAMAMLAADAGKDEFVSLREDWADADYLAAVSDAIAFQRGKVSIRIEDEKSRIQVNALVRFPDKNAPNNDQMELWDRFLSIMAQDRDDLEDVEPRAIVNALKDWIDSADDEAITGLSGAESGHYRSLEPSYGCRNGPIPHIGDLALVKGVSDGLLFGTDEHPGIQRYVTVDGAGRPTADNPLIFAGRININTADRRVVAAMMPVGMEDVAGAICDYREARNGTEYANDISRAAWYRDVPGFGLLGETDLQRFEALVTQSSDLFRIVSESQIDGLRYHIVAVVQRVKSVDSGRWRCRVLRWQAG